MARRNPNLIDGKPSDRDAKAFLAMLGGQPAIASRPPIVASEWNGIPNSSQGGFRGGSLDRLTGGWNPGNVGPNQAQKMGGAVMRQRARDLVLNNPFAQSAVDSYVANVIQSGITPKPKFAAKADRQKWVAAWERWGGASAHATRESDITQQSTIYEQQALWLTEIIVGGGCLLHFVEMPRKGRLIPLTLELLPEERFAEDVTQSGRNTKTANPVIDGCEVEQSTGRVVAYWVRHTNNLSDVTSPVDFNPIRLSRDVCEYAYFKKRLGQLRGHTLLHSAILWLAAIGYYVDNELYASNAKSSYAYTITTTDDSYEDNTFSDGSSCVVDANGNPLTTLPGGIIARLKPGEKIEGVGPNVPGSDSGTWLEMIIRSIGIGANISYEELARDFSKGSFSSVRASANSDRIRFRRMDTFTDGHFNNPIWPRFAASSVGALLDGFPTPQEFAADRDEWINVGWEGPHWESVNPSDDAKADDVKIKNGTKLRADCIPGDIDEHFDALEQEQATIIEKKLEFGIGNPRTDSAMVDAGRSDGEMTQSDQKKGKK